MNSAYVVVALRRISKKKFENIGLKKACKRFVVKKYENVEDVLSMAEDYCLSQEGQWRLYRTVSKRNLDRAKINTMKFLIDSDRVDIDDVWISQLLQPECDAEKLLLLDFDIKDEQTRKQVLKDTKEFLKDIDVDVQEERQTPNGFHLVTKRFDTRVLETMVPELEVKKNALLFISKV